MNYTFMHQNLPVAELELDDASGFIIKINKVYRPEHLPVGVSVKKGVVDRAAFNHWWTDRSIPASRSGVREALETLEIAYKNASGAVFWIEFIRSILDKTGKCDDDLGTDKLF